MFIEDWLSRYSHKTNRDEEIQGINITINAIEACTDIPHCMRTEEIGTAPMDDKHLSMPSEYLLHAWPSMTT